MWCQQNNASESVFSDIPEPTEANHLMKSVKLRMHNLDLKYKYQFLSKTLLTPNQ
jgi:hypothetical protein